MSDRILGLGVDLIEIDRIASAMTKTRFKERIFTKREQQILQKKSSSSWAGQFAAKEAVMKALGNGWQAGVTFLDIEILRDNLGKPIIELSGQAKEIAKKNNINDLLVSISHSRHNAVASVVAVGEVKTDGSCYI